MPARTIIALGEGKRREFTAAGTISPGDLVTVTSAGAVVRNAVAASNAVPMFAIENEIFGKGVEVDYVSGDRVLVEACHAGMEVNVTIAAAAAAIVKGDALEAAADGTLRKVALVTGAGVLAYAEEAIDNSGGGSKVRIRARLV